MKAKTGLQYKTDKSTTQVGAGIQKTNGATSWGVGGKYDYSGDKSKLHLNGKYVNNDGKKSGLVNADYSYSPTTNLKYNLNGNYKFNGDSKSGSLGAGVQYSSDKLKANGDVKLSRTNGVNGRSIKGDVTYTPNDKLSLNAHASGSKTGSDISRSFGVGATYKPNDHFSINGDYSMGKTNGQTTRDANLNLKYQNTFDLKNGGTLTPSISAGLSSSNNQIFNQGNIVGELDYNKGKFGAYGKADVNFGSNPSQSYEAGLKYNPNDRTSFTAGFQHNHDGSGSDNRFMVGGKITF
ncbi:hypothetical protein QTN25_008733 [Entamoeba marina]